MPKIVDHEQRKELLAEAAWRVIRREGLEGLSVRRVAEEAGVSLGSLRHYYETHAELLAYSMRLISDRVNRRIMELTYTGDVRTDMEQVIFELLPLDEVRRTEAEVWFVFTGKAPTDPGIRSLVLEVHDQLYQGFRIAMEALLPDTSAKDPALLETEVKRLHSLVDGLAIHHVLFPEQLSAAEMTRIVRRHLDSLAAASPPPRSQI
jgi:AcrR family transcriptional regulator